MTTSPFLSPRNPGLRISWAFFLGSLWLVTSSVYLWQSGSLWIASPFTHFLATFIWATVTAMLSLRFLSYLGYFGSLNPIPPKSHWLTLYFALVPVAWISKYLVLSVFHFEVLRYREIASLGVLVSLFCFFLELWLGYRFVRSGKRRLVFVALNSHERATLETALKERDLLRFYDLQEIGPPLERALQDPGSIHWIAISRSQVQNFMAGADLIRAQASSVPVLDYRQIRNDVMSRVVLSDQDAWAFLVHAVQADFFLRFYRALKPWTDRIVAALLLAVFWPVFAIVAVLIKGTDFGPVLFRQERLGFRGRSFRMLKFRSMRVDAEKDGPQWAVASDDRVTWIGKWIRKARIDELPQLWNVLRGDMSFVGPRPERPEFYAILEKEIPLFRLRLLMRPGITGWAQVLGGYAATVEESRSKLEYDLFYLQQMSLRIDLVIIMRTLKTVFMGKERK